MITRILILIFSLFLAMPMVHAAGELENNLNVRGVEIGWTINNNSVLSDFYSTSGIWSFFYTPTDTGMDGVVGVFTTIAFQIKNIAIALGVVFLAIAVIKLLFSANEEESVKKWRSSIIWVTVGIFVMQIAFSVWTTLLLQDSTSLIDSWFWWSIWLKIFSPIVSILQMLASLGFFLMVLYAFYTIVWGAWDEEKLKKWKRTIIYGLVGFFLLKVPQVIIEAIYGWFKCNIKLGFVEVCTETGPNTSAAVSLIGKVITYFNGFLMLICVLLVIYAGWLVLISGWDEERLKKARSIVLYVLVGFVVLVASHAIFRFFILQ